MKLCGGVDLQSTFAALLFLLSAATSCVAQERVVAIGDVHGAYPEFVGILQRTGLIDDSRQWVGGRSVLVQTGDALDRGPRTRECLDLLMELERQAEKQNGRVLPLLGNHEVLVLTGDLRYVTAEDYRAFTTDQSEKVREQAYREYRQFLAAHSRHSHTAVPDDEATRQKWMDEHPLGFFELRDQYSPQGVYGGWLRKHHAVVQLADVIFTHGGLNPKLPFDNVRELDGRIHSELASFDFLWQSLSDKKIIWRYMKLEEAIRQVQEEWMGIQIVGRVEDPDAAEKMQKLLSLQSWMIFSPDGPLWYRGLALEPEEKLKRDLEAMLVRLKARYLVVGHTIRPKFDVMARFDNRVFLIDTGMLKGAYGGRASALQIQNGRFTAYYTNGEQQVLLAPEDSRTAPALSHGEGSEKQKP